MAKKQPTPTEYTFEDLLNDGPVAELSAGYEPVAAVADNTQGNPPAEKGASALDFAKEFAASGVQGVGAIGQFVGEGAAALANKVTGTEDYVGKNLLKPVYEATRQSMTEGGKAARQDANIKGDVVDMAMGNWSEIDLPDTAGGWGMMAANGFGSLASSLIPYLGQASKLKKLKAGIGAADKAGDAVEVARLSAEAAKVARSAKFMGAGFDAAQTGGAAADDARTNVQQQVDAMSHEQLLRQVPIYADAFAKSGSQEQAASAVVNSAAQLAASISAPFGAAGGYFGGRVIEDALLKKGLAQMAGKAMPSRLGRTTLAGGAGSLIEGGQEVTEKVGGNIGENIALGKDALDDATRNTAGDFIGGAMVGGPVGAVTMNGEVAKVAEKPKAPNSPLSNAASAPTPAADAAVVGADAMPQQDPIAARVNEIETAVREGDLLTKLSDIGQGDLTKTEFLEAIAVAKNPTLPKRYRDMALESANRAMGWLAEGAMPNEPGTGTPYSTDLVTQDASVPPGAAVATQGGAPGTDVAVMGTALTTPNEIIPAPTAIGGQGQLETTQPSGDSVQALDQNSTFEQQLEAEFGPQAVAPTAVESDLAGSALSADPQNEGVQSDSIAPAAEPMAGGQANETGSALSADPQTTDAPRAVVDLPVAHAQPAAPGNYGTAQVRKLRAQIGEAVKAGFTVIEERDGAAYLVNPVGHAEIPIKSSVGVAIAKQAVPKLQPTTGVNDEGLGKVGGFVAGAQGGGAEGNDSRERVNAGGAKGASVRDATPSGVGQAQQVQRNVAADADAVAKYNSVDGRRAVLADPASPMTQALDALLDKFAELTGHRGIAIVDTDPGAVDGAYHPETGRFIVNVDRPEMHIAQTIVHEFEHLTEGRPGLAAMYDSMYRLIPEEVKQSYFEVYLNGGSYASITKSREGLLKSEMTADFMGQRFKDRTWLERVAKEKPHLFGNFVRDWIPLLENLITQLKGVVKSRRSKGMRAKDIDEQMRGYIKEFEQMKDIAIDVATAWAESNPGFAERTGVNDAVQNAKRSGPKEPKYQRNYLVPEVDSVFADGNIAHLPAIKFQRDGIQRTYPELPVRIQIGEHRRNEGDLLSRGMGQYGLQHRIENEAKDAKRGYITPKLAGDSKAQVEQAARDITLGVLTAKTVYADNSPMQVVLFSPEMSRTTVLRLDKDVTGREFWAVKTAMPEKLEQIGRRYKAPTSINGITLDGIRTQQPDANLLRVLNKLKEPGTSPSTLDSYILDEDGLLFNSPATNESLPVAKVLKQLSRDANGKIILNKNKVQNSGRTMSAQEQAMLQAELDGEVTDADIASAGLMAEDAFPDLNFENRKGLLRAEIPDFYRDGYMSVFQLEPEGKLWGAQLRHTWIGPANNEKTGYATLKMAKAFVRRFVASKQLRERKFDLLSTVDEADVSRLTSAWSAMNIADDSVRKYQVGDPGMTMKQLAERFGLLKEFDVQVSLETIDSSNRMIAVEFDHKTTGEAQSATLNLNKVDGKWLGTANTSNLGRAGLGAAVYQMFVEYAAAKNITIHPDHSLSGVNTYRRTEQMLAAAMRAGRSNVMVPHPVQRVYGFNNDASTPAEHDDNMVRLLLAGLRNVRELAPGVDKLYYHPETDSFTSRSGKDQSATVKKMLANTDARAFGLGRSTLARAVITRQVMDDEFELPESFAAPILYSARTQAETEYEVVKAGLEGSKGWMKAPNGKPTNLNERQWIHARTPSFKSWFGDWEKFAGTRSGVWGDQKGEVSKVVDENGEPLVVYHGTDKGGFFKFREPGGEKRGDIGIFTSSNLDTAKSYIKRGRLEMFAPDFSKAALEAQGFEFSEDGGLIEVADPDGHTIQGPQDGRFKSMDAAISAANEANEGVADQSVIYGVFMNVRRPYETDFEGALWNGSREHLWQVVVGDEPQEMDGKVYFTEDDARELAKTFAAPDDEYEGADYMVAAEDHYETSDDAAIEGHHDGQDGAIIRNVVDDGGGVGMGDVATVYVANRANQVKSADFNVGTYGRGDDIRYSVRGWWGNDKSADRFVGGLSTQMSLETQGTDFVPTDADMAKLGESVRSAAYEAGATHIIAAKTLSTQGRYGSIERSLDLELVTRAGYNPESMWIEMLRQAQAAKQDSTFLSRVLRGDEDVDMLRHRPGVEIYFDKPASPEGLETMLASLAKEGVEFLTVIVDGSQSQKTTGAMPPAVGVRLQYIPEFDQRYGFDDLSGLSDESIKLKIGDKAKEMAAIAGRVAASVKGVSLAEQLWYETQVAFSNQYKEKINGFTTGFTERATENIESQRWAGQSIREGIDWANRQNRESSAKGQSEGKVSDQDDTTKPKYDYQKSLDEVKWPRIRKLDADIFSIMHRVLQDANAGNESAKVLRLIYATGFRVGNDDALTGRVLDDQGQIVKAGEQTIGATTLQPSHVKIDGDRVTFDFVGKSGVHQSHTIVNAEIAQELASRMDRDRLFEVSPKQVINYLRRVSGSDYKSHDIRTWVATNAARAAIKAMPKPSTPEQFWVVYDTAIQAAAKKIGDTLKVAEQSYVEPTIFQEIRDAAGVPASVQRGRSKDSGKSRNAGRVNESNGGVLQSKRSGDTGELANLQRGGIGGESNIGNAPGYGVAIAGASSAIGYHFSKQARSSLNSNFYGTGLKGAEADRLAGDNADIRPRIFFYVNKGHGVRAESGVGSYGHHVRLDNLYDVFKDELNLVKGVRGQSGNRENNWERAVLDAGFDGYLAVDPVMPQGYAVLVGKKHTNVPVALTQAPGANPNPVTQVPVDDSATRQEGSELVRKPVGQEMVQLAHPAKQAKIRTVAPSFKMQYGYMRVDKSEAKIADAAIAEFSPTFRFVKQSARTDQRARTLDALRRMRRCLA